MDGGVRIEVDPELLAALLRELRAVKPRLATGMRREVRQAAQLVRDVAAAEILSYNGQGSRPRVRDRPAHTGMRNKLAESLQVRIVTSAKSSRQGVYVVSTGRLLPAWQKSLVKAMNRAEFEHPVFGDKGDRVKQVGARYFRPSTLATARTLLEARIRAVMDEALAELVR